MEKIAIDLFKWAVESFGIHSAIGALGFFIVLAVFKYLWTELKRANQVNINDKQQQIDRLAEENRVYREHFMKVMGVSEEELKRISPPKEKEK